MTANYKSRHGSIAIVKQPSRTGGLALASPSAFVTTGAGNAGGTTAVSTSLGGANDAAWVSNIVECVKSTNIQNVGCRAMVVAFAQSTNTLTFDKAFPAQVASGDAFRMYTTPDAPIVATSAVTGGATIIATGRTEADDYWNGVADIGGYYVEVVSADNAVATQHPLISDFTASSDTVTLGTSLGVNVAVGDFFRALKHVAAEGIAMLAPEQPDIPANTLVAGYGQEAPVPGNRGGGGAIVLHSRGPGRTRDGLASEADEALSCALTATAGRTGVVVHTGSTISSVVYDAGTPDVGDVLVTSQGDAFMVTADSGTALTPLPPLRNVPIDGETLVGARTYDPPTSQPGALTVYNWLGSGLLDIYYGCSVVPTFTWARGEHAKINLALRATDFYSTSGERSWYPRLPTSRAQRTRDMRVVLYDGTNTVELPCLGASFDPGVESKELVNLTVPNESSGYDTVNVQGGGALKVRVDSTTLRLLRDWEGRRQVSILIQSGATTGDSGIDGVIVYAATLAGVPRSDDGGEVVIDMAFTVVRSETAIAAGLPQYRYFRA